MPHHLILNIPLCTRSMFILLLAITLAIPLFSLDIQLPAYPCAPGQHVIINQHSGQVISDTLHDYTEVSYERMFVFTEPVKKIGSHPLTYRAIAVRQEINSATHTIEHQELLQGKTQPTLLCISLIASGILATGLFVYTLVASLIQNKKTRRFLHAF